MFAVNAKRVDLSLNSHIVCMYGGGDTGQLLALASSSKAPGINNVLFVVSCWDSGAYPHARVLSVMLLIRSELWVCLLLCSGKFPRQGVIVV